MEVSRERIRELLSERKAGHGLPAEFYGSEAIFQAELDLIFGQHWIYVGVEPDVPEAGDVARVELAGASILIVRGDDMQVRAFHNVCRHRGARLVTDEQTNVGNLVCRYHAWTYNLVGELIHANHMSSDFDPTCHGLKPVHLRSLAGLLFVCLSKDPPADFELMAQAMTPYVAPHGLANAKVAFYSDIIEEGNWKLTMENNRECDHCSANHPELTTSLFAYGFGYAPDTLDAIEREQADRYSALVREQHRQWEINDLPCREIEHLADRVTGFRCERLPLDDFGESQTIDTRSACRKLLGQLNVARAGSLSFWTQPNSWHHFMADHVVTFSVLPLSPERTLLRTKWLVHKDAQAGVDYDPVNLTRVWEATNRQDAKLVGLCQQGVSSPAYVPGPYSPSTEVLVEKFSAWYISRMAAGLDA